MNLNPLAKPSVASAVRKLENIMDELMDAQLAHKSVAETKAEEGQRLLTESLVESANAARAERIRTKLADLLA